MPDARPYDPDRPTHCRVDVEQSGDSLELTYPHWQPYLGWFLPYLLGLFGLGSVLITREAIANPSIKTFAFAVPCLAVWLVVLCEFFDVWSRKECLRLTPRGIEYEMMGRFRSKKREVPLHQVKSVKAWESPNTGEGTTLAVSIETQGEPIIFGKEIPSDEQTYIVKLLGRHLQQLRERASIARAPGN